MTEKRFKETISTGIVTDTITGKEYKCEMRIDEELLDLLNDLDEKRVDYYHDNEVLRQEIKRLEWENKQLREVNEDLEAFRYSVFKNISICCEKRNIDMNCNDLNDSE